MCSMLQMTINCLLFFCSYGNQFFFLHLESGFGDFLGESDTIEVTLKDFQG